VECLNKCSNSVLYVFGCLVVLHITELYVTITYFQEVFFRLSYTSENILKIIACRNLNGILGNQLNFLHDGV
jgi:hypothetical protein